MNDNLGTCRNGFVYRREGHYVIQYRSSGERVGYLCTLATWERTFAKSLGVF